MAINRLNMEYTSIRQTLHDYSYQLYYVILGIFIHKALCVSFFLFAIFIKHMIRTKIIQYSLALLSDVTDKFLYVILL